jgi:hypothetical protein
MNDLTDKFANLKTLTYKAFISIMASFLYIGLLYWMYNIMFIPRVTLLFVFPRLDYLTLFFGFWIIKSLINQFTYKG